MNEQHNHNYDEEHREEKIKKKTQEKIKTINKFKIIINKFVSMIIIIVGKKTKQLIIISKVCM